MDIDLDVDPTPAADGTTFPAPSTQTAPEASIDQEVIAPAPAVIVLPAPLVPPATSGVKNVEKSSTAAASGEVQISPTPISVDASIEDAVVDGFKGSLAKASEIELRLHELASDAEMMKTKMHVSTYVSPLPTGCMCSISELFLVDFQWGNYLVHPVGVAPKSPSNCMELLGVLCCRDYWFDDLLVGALLSAPTWCSRQGSE